MNSKLQRQKDKYNRECREAFFEEYVKLNFPLIIGSTFSRRILCNHYNERTYNTLLRFLEMLKFKIVNANDPEDSVENIVYAEIVFRHKPLKMFLDIRYDHGNKIMSIWRENGKFRCDNSGTIETTKEDIERAYRITENFKKNIQEINEFTKRIIETSEKVKSTIP